MFRRIDPEINYNQVTVYIDGHGVAAEPGEPLAAVLLRLDCPIARKTPISAKPRAPYCMMGICFECMMVIDGVLSRACVTAVQQGMQVERQCGARDIEAWKHKK